VRSSLAVKFNFSGVHCQYPQSQCVRLSLNKFYLIAKFTDLLWSLTGNMAWPYRVRLRFMDFLGWFGQGLFFLQKPWDCLSPPCKIVFPHLASFVSIILQQKLICGLNKQVCRSKKISLSLAKLFTNHVFISV